MRNELIKIRGKLDGLEGENKTFALDAGVQQKPDV